LHSLNSGDRDLYKYLFVTIVKWLNSVKFIYGHPLKGNMDAYKEYQYKKLNDLLCNSFNNVKYDVRDMNGKLENLKLVFDNFSTDSIKTVFEEQNKLILEQHRSINLLSERLSQLENRPIVRETRQIVEAQAPSAEHGVNLLQLRRLAKLEKKQPDKSIYDIPEGEIRITKVQFKAKGNGKKDLKTEWVEICGYNVDMSGFKLTDKGNKHTFKFPSGFSIYGPVKIFTGKGKNTNTKLYWNSARPIWNDSGDVATLKDRRGKVLSQVLSQPEYSFKTLK
jgi:hypothetical protein